MSTILHTKIYAEMGGVDFSGEPSEIPDTSFAYLENMYRDYGCGAGAGVETIPGYRPVARVESAIRAIHPHPTDADALILHAGKSLYRYDTANAASNSMRLPTRLLGEGGGFATVEGERTEAVIAGGALYLLDGKEYLVLKNDKLRPVRETAYCPLLRVNGEDYEQENLLTRNGKECYEHFLPEEYPYVTEEGLLFSVSADGVCRVSGYTGSDSLVVIPPYATVGSRRYAVAGVSMNAFYHNETVETLILSEGIALLENSAFFGMRALRTVVLPSTVTEIPIQCFDSCPLLATLYLPRTLIRIGARAFDDAPLRDVHFAGEMTAFLTIDGKEQILPATPPPELSIHSESAYTVVRSRLPLHPSAEQLVRVTVDATVLGEEEGGDIAFRVLTGEGRPLAVYLEAPHPDSITGTTILLEYTLRDTLPEELSRQENCPPGASLSAILGCTRIARFDDRLFLSGNPAFPGAVFYTHVRQDGKNDPSYIGIYNYFLDGDGRAAVRVLLSTPTSLFVMTEDVPGLPALYCHEPHDTGEDLVPRIYPAGEGIGGIGTLGAAIDFLGDHLFLSERGLDAIERSALCEERGIVHRSAAIDARLLREQIADATLFRFGTYLGVATGGNVYLADGRRRARGGEYEWYYLSGIGSFAGDNEVYYTVTGDLPAPLSDLLVLDEHGNRIPLQTDSKRRRVTGEAVRGIRVAGTDYTYTVLDGCALLTESDGEREGGIFSPATAFRECRGLLFFGTADGTLCLFNTDKRGEGGLIPRAYYSFAGHAYTSGCATKLDNCGAPARRKTTVRSGGAVRLKAMSGSKIEVRARTEDGRFTVEDTLYGGRGDFGETDFATAEFHLGEDTVVPLREAKRRWVEKQLYFVSEEYQRPFGILSVAYQWRDAGRI